MKKITVLLFTLFLFVNGQSDFWQNFQQSIQNFGHNLSAQLQAQGKIIAENAKQLAEQVEQQQRENAKKIQEENNKIFEVVKQIEDGNTPVGTISNTTSLSTNVNGQVVTINNTIISNGNDQEGFIQNVFTVYEEGEMKDWSINLFSWYGNKINKRYYNKKGFLFTSEGYATNLNINEHHALILQKAEQIETGNTPTGLKSTTSSLFTKVNGKDITVKSTIYSIGSAQSGAIHIIQTIYEGNTRKNYSINSIFWNNNQVTENYYNDQGISYSGNFLSSSNGLLIQNSYY